MAQLRKPVHNEVPPQLMTFEPALWFTPGDWVKAREDWLQDHGYPKARPGLDPDTPFGRIGDRFRASHSARVAAAIDAAESD